NAVRGTMLVVMSADELRAAMGVINEQLGGQVSLVQTISGPGKAVVTVGSGGVGEVRERTLLVPHWEVHYTPGAGLPPLIPDLMVFILVLVPALLAAIAVWVLLGAAQKNLRRDVAVLIQWAQKAF